MKLRLGIAVVLAGALAALVVPAASANYVYWGNLGGTTVGRVALDGSQLNNNFVLGATNGAPNNNPSAVATDTQHIYWTHETGIGRANLDGSGVIQNFIPATLGSGAGIAINSNFIYWSDGDTAIGRANIDGTAANPNFIPDTNSPCGLAATDQFLYYTVYLGGSTSNVARVPIGGGTPDDNFIMVPGGKDCGVAADASHLYWTSSASDGIERANLDGTQREPNFISGIVAYGVAVTPQYVFWGSGFTDHAIGRANIDGTGKNQLFAVAGTGNTATPYLISASPSNSFTVGAPTLNKKNGTAKIQATLSGPGVVVADAASKGVQAVASKKKKASPVKRVQKTANSAATLTLKIRANGKTLKALKSKGKAKVKVGITFTPAGVAGVPAQTTLKLVLKRR